MGSILNSLLLLSLVDFTLEHEVCPKNQTGLDYFQSRSQEVHKIKKRSLVFPKGSVFVMTISVVKLLPVKGFTWNHVHEFDVIWPIPNEADKIKPKQILNKKQKYPMRKTYFRRPYWKIRRHRRELYSNFELAFERFNLPGKSCILRTICEAKTLLNPPGVSLIKDILRVIFSNPIIIKHITDEYELAHETQDNCNLTYSCPFSLLNFLLSNFND